MRLIFVYFFLSLFLTSCHKCGCKKHYRTFTFDFNDTIHPTNSNKNDYYTLLIKYSLNDENKLFELTKLSNKMKSEGRKDSFVTKEIAKIARYKMHAKINQKIIDKVALEIKTQIPLEMKNLITTLMKHGNQVYIIGGGVYGCAVIPEVVKDFGIPKNHVYSGYFGDFSEKSMQKIFVNDFKYINCATLDLSIPTTDDKSSVIKYLKDKKIIKNKITHIGDGTNDLEVQDAKVADKYIGFGVHRIVPKVKENAKIFVVNFEEFKKKLRK